MIEIPVHTIDGKQTGSVKLDETLLGGEIRPSLLKQAYVMYHANKRQGSARTRSRGLVEGSTRKLYRQKGTGNARRGAVRTNVMKGGGVAFAKTQKDWRQQMPVKMRRLATRNAVLAKAVDGEIKIVDKFDFAAPKTKQFAAALGALGIDRSCLLAVNPADVNTRLSARNIADIGVIEMDQLNAYDLLSRRFLLVDQATFQAWVDGLKPTKKVEEAA
ncbi:50S ribosomal protein L4 [Planctomycetales bacterium ZRK34]|nr:50S ribosomal protein L4 [Planctomycetales bacterium ZRK34]